MVGNVKFKEMNQSVQQIQVIPLLGEAPSAYADRLGVYYSSLVTKDHKKNNGQFFTPLQIANFMASFCKVDKEKLKILDPGCGIGILSTALIEALIIRAKRIKIIELVVFETDINILPFTEKCFDYLRSWLNENDIDFKIFLCKNDFILHNSLILNGVESPFEDYDIIISNPPYFKLPNDDERAIAARSVIYGQTNIYNIFLIIAAKLLKTEGELIFITPRSFCSGNYFRLFREIFFSMVSLKEIHLFDSRTVMFKRDKVLQENIIIKATINSKLPADKEELVISSSAGINDINERRIKKYKLSSLINLDSFQKVLHLPTSDIDEEVVKIFKTWTGSLKQYNLEVSTGPVVDFRSREMIEFKKYKNTVPLIWLHNIESMKYIWPRKNGYKGKPKGQYIINDEKSFSRLVKNNNYVLVRRFSTKDDTRRLIAAPYFKSYDSNVTMIGIENHLNYIYSKKGELTIEQSIGLAALLNSRLFDLYFRTFNGTINVSATELRDFPLPNFQLIQLLGQKIKRISKTKVSYNIDTLVSEIFNLSIDLSILYGG
jgi:adenine-specific DNA-methyltransferase